MATYVTAHTVEQAVAALASGARPIAGGTDLVVGGRQGKKPLPESLVGIHRVAGLGSIDETTDGLNLGALVTHAAIAANDLIRARYTGLADASALVGSHATRANGTIGGNVMNASPAMDTGAPLLCLGAQAELVGPGRSPPGGPGRALDGPGDHQRSTGRASRVDSHTHPGRGNRKLLCPTPIPSTDGDRRGRSGGGR